MILTILAVLLLVFGLICLWRYQTRKHYWQGGGWAVSAFMCIMLGSICVICATTGIIDAAINNDIRTENLVEQRNVIEYRLDQSDKDTNIMVNGGVYQDIVEYNNTIRKYKKWSNNLWVNWFWSKGPAALEYIELPKGAL